MMGGRNERQAVAAIWWGIWWGTPAFANSATESKRFVVRPRGFEPLTFCSGGKWREGIRNFVCIAEVGSLPPQANFRPTRFDSGVRGRRAYWSGPDAGFGTRERQRTGRFEDEVGQVVGRVLAVRRLAAESDVLELGKPFRGGRRHGVHLDLDALRHV